MNYLSLLGKELKSDDLLELLEVHDIKVTYDFDRNHENLPDCYWAGAHDLGLLLKFDENQILRTIFLFVAEDDGYKPADLSQSDIRIFGSKPEIRDFASKNDIAISAGETEFLGTNHNWIRLDYLHHSIHYDFEDGSLKKITLALAEKEK